MRKTNCPILINWHESEVVPLHIIAREILRCGSDDIKSDKIYYVDHDYFFGNELHAYNIVIGAKDIEDVIEMYNDIEIENQELEDREHYPGISERGGLTPKDKRKLRNSISLWEDKYKLNKYQK